VPQLEKDGRGERREGNRFTDRQRCERHQDLVPATGTYSDGSLFPGMYAQVKFTLPEQRTSLIVPNSSLIVDHRGMHVVTVDANHTVHFVPVTISKDMGKEVEILNGLHGSEALVSSPSDLLNEGDHVEVR
jgi:hypothetical protein